VLRTARLVLGHATMMNHRALRALSFSVIGLLWACEGAHEGTTTSAAAPNQSGVANSQASADHAIVDELSTARCDRETSCSNVGDGHKYASHSVCMDQMRGSLANDLNSYTCPRGIDRMALDHCLAAIKNEECSHPMDTLKRVDECRTGALCMK
jgi:hypothetical protein